MNDPETTGVPKVHPASREMLPDDPLNLHACEVPGDAELMLRLLVEEYARLGWGLEPILRMACDPNFLAFHGLWQLYGEAGLRERIANILSRSGVMRFSEYEAPVADADTVDPDTLNLVQIT